MNLSIFIFLTYFYHFFVESTALCTDRKFGSSSSFVCVCNATNCHYSESIKEPLEKTQVRFVKSSKDKYRNLETTLPLQVLHFPEDINKNVDVTIKLNSSDHLQMMMGFGGAFTDAAGINIRSLSTAAQNNLLKAYFSDEGSAYNLCRLPIAGTDFSTRPYSYDDHEGDIELNKWALALEDYKYKLPIIRKAISLASREFKIIASPWSPPSWMKSNGKFNESGTLDKGLWDVWSNYIVKFVKAYEDELEKQMWGLTPQNEPLSGLEPDWKFNCLGWTAESMRDWIKTSLGPILENAGMRRLVMMVDDFNRYTLPSYPEPMISDPESNKFIDGIAVHWYDDQVIGPSVLDETHEAFPEKFILYTEACEGWNASAGDNVILGSWERGENYIKDIIEAVNHWSTGWIDWNLALNMDGGPNWANNNADSPIIVNEEEDEFYLQPTYFALNLISRNVEPGASRISFSVDHGKNDGKIHSTAFQNPDNSIVIILANVGDDDLVVQIEDLESEPSIKRTLEAKTWEAIQYWPNVDKTRQIFIA